MDAITTSPPTVRMKKSVLRLFEKEKPAANAGSNSSPIKVTKKTSAVVRTEMNRLPISPPKIKKDVEQRSCGLTITVTNVAPNTVPTARSAASARSQPGILDEALDTVKFFIANNDQQVAIRQWEPIQ